MLKEFREFAIKGNMVDLAIAVIIGAAFGAVVNSLVKDVLMPPIGLLLGNVDFKNLMFVLKEGTTPGPYPTPEIAAAAKAVTINYGNFLNLVIDFVVVAFVAFLVVKAVNRTRRKEEEAPAAEPAPTKEEVLLTEIRDLLAKKA